VESFCKEASDADGFERRENQTLFNWRLEIDHEEDSARAFSVIGLALASVVGDRQPETQPEAFFGFVNLRCGLVAIASAEKRSYAPWDASEGIGCGR
jgi:hypothetical protein